MGLSVNEIHDVPDSGVSCSGQDLFETPLNILPILVSAVAPYVPSSQLRLIAIFYPRFKQCFVNGGRLVLSSCCHQ